MENIIIASNNKHKISELSKMLNKYNIISLNDLNEKYEPNENGTSLKENAYIKAKYYFDKYHENVISDDSGLFVTALNGLPGIFSARYASLGNNNEFHDDLLNRKKLLQDLKIEKNREAKFICVICLIEKNGNVSYFVGETLGCILEEERGNNGFGYDSLFYSYDLSKTFAEATEEEKAKVSHRGRSILKLKEYINGKGF